MHEKLRALVKYPAREPRELLRRFADEAQKHWGDDRHPLPLVTVYLREGPAFTGRVVRVDRDVRDEVILLHAPDNLTNPQGHVAYLPSAHVVAVRVHDADAHAPLLSEGAVARRLSEEAPSRLQVKREFQQLSERLPAPIDADWDALPKSDEAHLNLRDFALALEKAVLAVTDDDLARDAWKSVRKLTVAHDARADLSAKRHDRTIAIALDLSRPLPADLASRLSQKLTTVL